MKSIEGETWETSYWDDILHEFGEHAYVELRYEQGGFAEREAPASTDRKEKNMEFVVSIRGQVTVELDRDSLEDLVREQVSNDPALNRLDDYEIEDIEEA